MKSCLLVGVWMHASVPCLANEIVQTEGGLELNGSKVSEAENIEGILMKYSQGLLSKSEVERIQSFIRLRQVQVKSDRVRLSNGQAIECISGIDTLDLLAKRCRPIKGAGAATELSLGPMLMRALIFSPIFKSKIAISAEKRWLVRQAFSTWYPNLSLSSGSVLRTYINNRQNYGSPSDSTNPSVSGTAFQPTDPISTTSAVGSSSDNELVPAYTTSSSYTQAYPVVTLNWAFFDPTRADSINAAKAAFRSSLADARYTTHQVISQVSQAYGTALTNEYAIAAYLQQKESYERLVELTENQVNKGYTPINQLLTLKSQQSDTDYKLNSAVIQYLQVIDSLKALLGISEDENFRLSDEAFLPGDWPYKKSEINEMIESYPQVRSYYEQSEQYRSMASSQFKGYIPKLSVLGYTTYVGTQGSMSFSPPQQPSGAWSQQLSNYIGLNATWNIFDGFSDYQTGMSFMSQSESYKQQAKDAAMSLKEQIYSALSLFNRRELLIKPLRRSYAFAVGAITSEKNRASIGFDNPSSIYNAEIASSQVISDFSEAYSDVLNAYFSLLDLSGTFIYREQ